MVVLSDYTIKQSQRVIKTLINATETQNQTFYFVDLGFT